MPNAKTSEVKAKATNSEDQSFGETEEDFWAKAQESLLDYRRTGLHLTQEEVEEWMKKRARGERVPMPKLHT